MKKVIISAALSLVSLTSNANVLCNVSSYTTSAGTVVAGYIRSQTACVTTTYASTSSIATQLVRVGTVVAITTLLSTFLENKKNEIQAISQDIVKGDYELVSCIVKHKVDKSHNETLNFLIGKDIAVSKWEREKNQTGNTYSFENNKYIRHAPFSTMTFDNVNLTLTATGSHSNYYADNCQVIEQKVAAH